MLRHARPVWTHTAPESVGEEACDSGTNQTPRTARVGAADIQPCVCASLSVNGVPVRLNRTKTGPALRSNEYFSRSIYCRYSGNACRCLVICGQGGYDLVIQQGNKLIHSVSCLRILPHVIVFTQGLHERVRNASRPRSNWHSRLIGCLLRQRLPSSTFGSCPCQMLLLQHKSPVPIDTSRCGACPNPHQARHAMCKHSRRDLQPVQRR